jgi:hypothetical protein
MKNHRFYILNHFVSITIHTCRAYRPSVWYNVIWEDYKRIVIEYSKNKTINTDKEMAAKKYTLTECLIPFTKNKEILNDLDAGGIKLIYSVKNVKSTLSQKDVGKVIFLKPYKKNWGISKKDVGKNEWGNTFSPYSNVWLQINEDYKSYDKEIMNIRYTIVKDSNLISKLNKQTKEFVIGTDEEIREIPLTEKIRFKLITMLDKLKIFYPSALKG